MRAVSVILPVYNAGHFVEKGIASVLEQTLESLELIVIDDGSTDQTLDILKRLSDKHDRIKVVENEINRGIAHSRNLGISIASGDWIAVLDADDWWDGRRLAILLDVAVEHSADIVADNQFFVANDTSRPWGMLFPEQRISTRLITIDDFLRHDMPGKYGTWGLLKPVFRKSFLIEHGIRYDKNLRVHEDTAFILQCFVHTPRFVVCSQPLYYYRLNPGSISFTLRIPDLMKSQDISRYFLKLFREKGNESTCKLLSQRLDRMDEYIRYRNVIEPVKRGEWRIAARQATKDIGIAPYVVRMLLRFVNRMIRKKLSKIRAPRSTGTPAGEDTRCP